MKKITLGIVHLNFSRVSADQYSVSVSGDDDVQMFLENNEALQDAVSEKHTIAVGDVLSVSIPLELDFVEPVSAATY